MLLELIKTVNIEAAALSEEVSLFHLSLYFYSHQNIRPVSKKLFKLAKMHCQISALFLTHCNSMCLKDKTSKPNDFIYLWPGELIRQHWFG